MADTDRRIAEAGTVAAHAGAFEVRDLLYRGRARYPRHSHAYSSLFVILGGHVRECVRGQGIDCGTGSIGFIPAGAEHESEFGSAPAHGLTVKVDESWLERMDERAPSRRELGYAAGARVGIAALRLHACCRTPDVQRVLATEELLVELIGAASGSQEDRDARRDARDTRWLARLTDVLRDSSDRSISLGEAAQAAGRNPAHAARAFRAAFGCSMTEYLRLARISRACWRLRATREPLASIAVSTGFFDQAHFARTFRRVMGVTPAAYRASFAPRDHRA